MNANGFTGNEIVSRVLAFVGDSSSSFQEYIEDSLNLAQFRFCKAFDWSFLQRSSVPLAVDGSAGVNEYNLSAITDPISSNSVAIYTQDISMIHIATPGMVLRKISMEDLRRLDPNEDDGGTSEYPQLWCPISDTRIKLWPPTSHAATLSIECKVTPSYWSNLSLPPIIPFKYQESFIRYVIALGLEYVDDTRAEAKKAEALDDIKADIQADLMQGANVDLPRLRAIFEARYDGTGANLNSLLFGFLPTED